MIMNFVYSRYLPSKSRERVKQAMIVFVVVVMDSGIICTRLNKLLAAFVLGV